MSTTRFRVTMKKAPNSHGFVNPRQLEQIWIDQFDWVYREYDYAVFAMTIHPDVSGKAIANLATEELSHPNPVFHGDTLFCETEVLDVKPSKSKPDRGVVKVHTRVLNQDGVLVAEFKRLVLVPRREPGE